LIELEGLNPDKQKRIELFLDMDFEPDTIYVGAEEIIQDLFLHQVNTLWMDFQAIPNIGDEFMVEFSNHELFGQVIQKIYSTELNTLKIELNLKLIE